MSQLVIHFPPTCGATYEGMYCELRPGHGGVHYDGRHWHWVPGSDVDPELYDIDTKGNVRRREQG